MSDEARIREETPQIAISNTTTEVNKTGSWKYIRPLYRDLVAPCNQACPVGIDIEGYMNLLRQGDEDAARDLLFRENPMPATTGRVCHHPCELACNRRGLDEAVSIHAVERMLGDQALARRLPLPVPRTRKQSVAIVGSGPAGLACGFHLVRLGYGVTIFEASSVAGGVLRSGIPDYRLPPEVLDGEIDRIQALGVTVRCAIRLGIDVPWSSLDLFDAVFLATGARRSRVLKLEGAPHEDVRPGLDFLRQVNNGARPDLGPRVVVVGGGNTAMDCARTALRLGSEVTVVYRRGLEEMPAIAEEVAEARREGVEFRLLAAPRGLRLQDGRLAWIECIRMRLEEPDESGRRRPVPVEGSQFLVQANTVLTAVGEDLDPDDRPPTLRAGEGPIPVDRLNASDRTGWFAGGDAVEQPRSVADALGSGKRAAIGIDRYLRSMSGERVSEDPEPLRLGPEGNLSITRWRRDDPVARHGQINRVVSVEELNMEHFDHVAGHPDGHLGIRASRRTFREVNQGLDPATARKEARRCLNCGVCNHCELCLIYCPDVAIKRRGNGRGFDIAYDYCKGCGVCARECPRGAMTMTREGL